MGWQDQRSASTSQTTLKSLEPHLKPSRPPVVPNPVAVELTGSSESWVSRPAARIIHNLVVGGVTEVAGDPAVKFDDAVAASVPPLLARLVLGPQPHTHTASWIRRISEPAGNDQRNAEPVKADLELGERVDLYLWSTSGSRARVRGFGASRPKCRPSIRMMKHILAANKVIQKPRSS